MDVTVILKELRDEREAVEQAIASVERLAAGQRKRRGRPPAWMKSILEATKDADTKRKRGRPRKSEEA
jgi:hypothetical protein